MNYQETLQVVRAQNPKLPYKECQKKAKTLYEAYKAGQADLKARQPAPPVATPLSQSGPAPVTPRLPGAIPLGVLHEAEQEIRKGPVDVNKIMNVGYQVIPDGQIVNYGKAENKVNTLVAFEDLNGNRLPTEGFFEIFIAGR